MTGLWTALALLCLVLLLSRAGRRLARASWPTRAPAFGVVAWQSLSLSLVLSLVLASVALVLPQLPAATSLQELAHLCTTVLLLQLQRPDTAVLTALGLLGVVVLSSRFGWLLVRGRVAARERRRRQHTSLVLTGREEANGLTIVEHGTPVVYCLPGRNSRIVATTGATDLLSADELEHVLAHERAHLRLRHDLALAVAEALARTFPGVRTFDVAATQVARLAEMQADDAAGVSARPELARALLRLAHGPVGTLSAGGATVDRARRLLAPAAPLPRLHRALVAAIAVLAVVTPVALGLLPGLATDGGRCCSTTTGSAYLWDLDERR